MIRKDIWEDQKEFNAQVQQLPADHAELIAVTKEFTLHMMTEMAEFLDAGQVFGAHRRIEQPMLNRENVKRQLIDMAKYWMCLCQAWGFTPAEMEQTYWRKSATVRQRFAEEFLRDIARPIAVIDLDGVMCDFIGGFCDWVGQYGRLDIDDPPRSLSEITKLLDHLRSNRTYINEQSLGVSLRRWNELQHEFRASGWFARLPIMPGARALIQFCHAKSWAVVGLTSRPIAEYPNLYDDTVAWLDSQNLKFDRIWWGAKKNEKLSAMIPDIGARIRFAVDDEPRYVEQFASCGVERVYWYRQGYGAPLDLGRVPHVQIARLQDIIDYEENRDGIHV